MTRDLPLGPAACALPMCSRTLSRTASHPNRRYCSRAHMRREVNVRYAEHTRKTVSHRTPRFVLEMLEETPKGCCILCEEQAARIICKEPECLTAYHRLYKAERRENARATVARARLSAPPPSGAGTQGPSGTERSR